VLGGGQGIGKDTLLAPIKHAVGSWNFQDISPTNLLEPFNLFVKAVALRMNEAHDLGESERRSPAFHCLVAAPERRVLGRILQ
jgi:hypothetical protein